MKLKNGKVGQGQLVPHLQYYDNMFVRLNKYGKGLLKNSPI